VFPSVAKDLAALPVHGAWIDGEVVVLDAEGRTSFQALQNVMSQSSARGLAFFVFDIMYLDGYDLRGVVLTERKRVLREIVGKGRGNVRASPDVQGGGADFFAQACKLKLEGSIAKRATSTYASGIRSREWLKIKCIQRQEMVIGGYTEPQGSRKGFGALLIGYHEDGKLRYAGKVGTGFDDRMLRELTPQLAKREQDAPAFVDPPRGYEAKGAHWVRPDLVAEIAFTEWSRDGALRHPSFQGLKLDKKASEVVREMPASLKRPEKAPAAAAKRASAKKDARPEIAGIALSNPDKPYFPEAGITKGDLARYYEAVAPHLLPHIAGRPLSLVRCPEGWSGECFYQKHAAKMVNAAVPRVEVRESKGTATYLGANSAKALVGLVQWGVIEMHPWGSRTPKLDRPDRLIFDFDPDPSLPWQELVTAVTLLRTLLDEMGLTGFLKTTGGKGLHVVLPIRATLSWDDVKAFTKSVADFMVRTFPDRFTAVMSKEKRKGRIFLDYLRNTEGATAIAPYGVRARANAPVAMPIAWDELTRDIRNDFFNVRNAPDRLASMKKDPWGDFFDVKQTVTAAMRKRLL
jgi:bifunctional non-homologous end joining protein LigD